MRAVLPEPTGLGWSVSREYSISCHANPATGNHRPSSVATSTCHTGSIVPSNSDSEGPVFPVSSLDDGQLATQVAPRPVEDLMRVAVIRGFVRMRMRRAFV